MKYLPNASSGSDVGGDNLTGANTTHNGILMAIVISLEMLAQIMLFDGY
jgi:hypothetical protein